MWYPSVVLGGGECEAWPSAYVSTSLFGGNNNFFFFFFFLTLSSLCSLYSILQEEILAGNVWIERRRKSEAKYQELLFCILFGIEKLVGQNCIVDARQQMSVFIEGVCGKPVGTGVIREEKGENTALFALL